MVCIAYAFTTFLMNFSNGIFTTKYTQYKYIMGPNGSETKYKLKKKKLYNYLITRGTGTIPESHFRLSGIYSNGYCFFPYVRNIPHNVSFTGYWQMQTCQRKHKWQALLKGKYRCSYFPILRTHYNEISKMITKG